jgi:hypothetical protein
MIFLPGPGGVDGLFFVLGLLLWRRLLGGWNGGNRTQHHEGKYQRDQAAQYGLLRTRIVTQINCGPVYTLSLSAAHRALYTFTSRSSFSARGPVSRYSFGAVFLKSKMR